MLQRKAASFFILSLLFPYICARSLNSRNFQRNPIAQSQQVDSGNTCHQAQLPPGCCKWEIHGNCGVENRCYCDIDCKNYGDCCCDVPELFDCNQDTVVTIREGTTCLSETTTPQQSTQATAATTEIPATTPTTTEIPTTTPTTTEIPTTTPISTALPPTCSAHGLNNGPSGCCEGDECFVLDSNSVCFCDRNCHDTSRHEPCCSDVISNGCFPQTCSQKGIKECCTSSNREECGVQISQNTTCYCDSSCVGMNDCCSDAVQICAQTQAVQDSVKAQVANFIEAIEKDKSSLYEQMAAAFWRRFNKMNKN